MIQLGRDADVDNFMIDLIKHCYLSVPQIEYPLVAVTKKVVMFASC